MDTKNLLGILFIAIALIATIAPLASADTLLKADFEQESFAKTVDYFDYARSYASLNNIATPAGFENYHANMYMAYVNTSGLQLLYAGLENVTFDSSAYLRIPMQSFIMHFKTSNSSRDVIMASTFLMLMAFNETSGSLYPNSPDVSDTLYASFSLGFDLSALNATLPALNSKTETIPLAQSKDKLQWSWGMKYTNLTALWWRTWIDPNDPHFDNSWPIALTVYDELTFTYTLTINPTAHTATLTENHVIGRMRELIVGLLPLLWVRYNSTGTYGMLSRQISNETIYDYIQTNQIKMSIVDFQTSVLADHETYSMTPSGQNVTSTETPVTDTSIGTYSDDGEKIFNADFGSKKTYNLYNYTADPTETTFNTYDATTRTAKASGFAGNTGLFKYQIGLMKFLPLVVIHMYPALFAKAEETISNLTRADYFYLTGYPTYGGYRIEHDPTFTAYIASEQAITSTDQPRNVEGLVTIAIVIAAVAVGIVIVTLWRKPKKQSTTQS